MVGLMTVVVLISNLVLFDFLFFFFFGLNFVLDPKCKYEDLISY